MKKVLTIFFCLIILINTKYDGTLNIINYAYADDKDPTNDKVDGMVKIFCNIINVITGTIGKAIAILILVSLAIGLFVGKVTWGLAIAVMVGMGLLFGAKDVIDTVTEGMKGVDKNICGKKD